MGKAKRTRKQWRNIDTKEVDEFLEKSTREARQGLVVDGIPDADLFFIDKAPQDQQIVEAPLILPRKLQARQRLTRAQAILRAVGSAHPISIPPKRKQTQRGSRWTAKHSISNASKLAVSVPKAVLAPQPEDIWEEQDEEQRADKAAAAASDFSAKPNKPSRAPKRRRTEPIAPAVEIDVPGCSFNPDRELHQDAVAEAVARELKKEYDRALQPTAPVRVVDYQPETDELELLQVDAEAEEDSAGQKESEEGDGEGDDMENDAMVVPLRTRIGEKKTQKDRNREARRKAEERELQKRKQEKLVRTELANLKHVRQKVDEEIREREARAARRRADAEELAASEPPRLGKLKFEPMQAQVLTTEELEAANGSLRRIKPTAMLAKDRFKSLQRRGVIEPRRKVERKVGKKVVYVHGKRAEKAMERQAEVDELRAKRMKKAAAGGPVKIAGKAGQVLKSR